MSRGRQSDREVLRNIHDKGLLDLPIWNRAAIVEPHHPLRDDPAKFLDVWATSLLGQCHDGFEKLIRKVNRNAPRPLGAILRLPVQRPEDKKVARVKRVEFSALREQRADLVRDQLFCCEMNVAGCIHGGLLLVLWGTLSRQILA